MFTEMCQICKIISRVFEKNTEKVSNRQVIVRLFAINRNQILRRKTIFAIKSTKICKSFQMTDDFFMKSIQLMVINIFKSVILVKCYQKSAQQTVFFQYNAFLNSKHPKKKINPLNEMPTHFAFCFVLYKKYF